MLGAELIYEYIFSNNLLIVCLSAAILIFLLWKPILEKHRYPPGPVPLPLIANQSFLFAAAGRAAYRYNHWKKYGNVVSYHALGKWHVDLNGYDTIYECFVKNADHFSERPPILPLLKYVDSGVSFDPRWKELRRQALTVLRDHGMGKDMIEEKIREEIEYNFDLLSTKLGQQSSDTFKKTIGLAIANIISQVLFGNRLDYTDDNLKALCHTDASFLTIVKSSVIPFYKHLPWDPLRLREAIDNLQTSLSLFKSEIERHKASLDVDHPKDYIDSYLIEAVKTGDPLFADEGCLVSTVLQLFIAGFDTTSTTLTWALLYSINRPSVQQKLHDEITQVVGSRNVAVSDRDSMHYTQAFIHEVLRCSSIAPQSLDHLCTKDTVIQGHNIPAGTTVIGSFYSTYHDEQVYPDSYSFTPERFLDDKGKFVKPSAKQFLPFGIGKRACLGESLARTELFMVWVSFVQRFEVCLLSDELVSEDGVETFAFTPKPFDFVLKQRV